MNIEISNKEMANYLNYAMNLAGVKKLVGNSIFAYSILGNWFAKYYVSTGDNSIEGIVKLLNLYKDSYYEGKYSNIDYAFMELIMEKVLQQNNIDHPTIIDKHRALQIIKLRNDNNLFYTHCFPGAIIDIVKENGLDSTKMPNEELMILEKYNKTPYKTGSVCYCELSKAGFDYAYSGVPERLNYAIGGLKERLEGESKNEQYLRSLKENLDVKKELSQDTKELLLDAGKKIIDFYCSDKRAGIAVFRNNGTVKPTIANIKFSSIFNSQDKEDRDFVHSIIGKKLKDIFDELDSNPENGLTHYNQLMEETMLLFPDLYEKICKKIDEMFYAYMKSYAINNYSRGYADGYEVQTIPRNAFEIVVTETPLDMSIDEEYNEKRKINIKPKEDLIRQIIQREEIIKKIIKENKNFNRVDRIEDIDLTICIDEGNIDFLDRYFIKSSNGGFFVADCSKTRLEFENRIRLCDYLLENSKEEEISNIIENYKQTDEYKECIEDDANYFKNPKTNIKKIAVTWFAKKEYENLSSDTKARMIVESMKKIGFSYIKIVDGHYEVKRGNETKTYQVNTIIDKSNDAPLNNLYQYYCDESSEKRQNTQKH